jgi:hypothetical protein
MQDQFMGMPGGTTWVFICYKKFSKIKERCIPGDIDRTSLA